MRITLKGTALKGFCYQLITAEGCDIQLYPFKSISYTFLQNNFVIAQNSKSGINSRTEFRALDHPDSAFFGSEHEFEHLEGEKKTSSPLLWRANFSLDFIISSCVYNLSHTVSGSIYSLMLIC